MVLAPPGAASNFIASLFEYEFEKPGVKVIEKSNEYCVDMRRWTNTKHFPEYYKSNVNLDYVRSHELPEIDYSDYEIDTLYRITHDLDLKPYVLLLVYMKYAIKDEIGWDFFNRPGFDFDKESVVDNGHRENYQLVTNSAKHICEIDYGKVFLDLEIPPELEQYSDDIMTYTERNFETFDYWSNKMDELKRHSHIIEKQRLRYKKSFN